MSSRAGRVLSVPLVAVALGMFLMQLDAMVANLALPSIGNALGTSVSGLQWVIDGYTIPLAAMLLIGGRLGDRFGHRGVFLTGLVLFGIGSLGAALAGTPTVLVAARVVQGLGAALELPTSLALLARCYPAPALRVKAIGVWATVGGLALAVGPLVGGPLVAWLGWESVFLINLPVVLLALVLTWRGIPADTRHAAVGLSVPSQFFGTLVLVALTVGIIEHAVLQARPWALAVVIGVFVLAIVGFVWAEKRSSHPLLPGAVLGNRSVLGVTASALVMGFVLFGLLFVYALVFQQHGGDSAAVAGFRFLPLALMFLATGPLAGRAGARNAPRLAAGVGMAFLGAGTLVLAFLPAAASYLWVAVAFIAVGIGYGLLSTTLAIAALGSLPAEQHGIASAIQNTARQLGGVLGVAIAGAQITSDPTHPTITANLTFTALAIAAIVLLATLAPHTARQEGTR